MVKTAQSLLLGVTWVAAALGLWFFLCDGSFTQPSGDHHGPFLGPRRLTLTSEVEPSTCCRFAHRFEGVNWSDATVHSDFLANVLSVERRFFAAPSIAFDEESGMTYDGTSLNLSTGDVESDGLRLFSAPSKESLHISLLALALQNPKDVSPEFRKLKPLIYSEKEALDILEKKVKDERDMGDSISKFLEVLQVCDEMGIETAPAEVAAGIFVLPMFSWYSWDFVSKALRQQHASATDADAKVTIDQWIQWPFQCGAADAWKFFMRMNEASLRATLVAKTSFERFCDQPAQVLTMTHFLTRPELSFDWTIPGIWDHIGCEGLDEQVRAIGSDCHVYGRACMGHQVQEIDGLSYVHNYIGSTDQHRPGMAPFCIFDNGTVLPTEQPTQANGFNFQPLARPEEPPRRTFGGG